MTATTPGAGPPAPTGPRRWLGLLVAVALVVGGVAYTVEQREDDARARPPATQVSTPPQSAKPTRIAAAVAARRVAIDTILIRRA